MAQVDHLDEVVEAGVAIGAALDEQGMPALMPSMRELDSRWVTAAMMPSKWWRMRRARVMKALMLERVAAWHHLSRCRVAALSLSPW
jgi:hypothetical protein